jgi:hypothetical protein
LGNGFLISCSVFWLIRTVQQFIFLYENHYSTYIWAVIVFIPAVLFALPVVVR